MLGYDDDVDVEIGPMGYGCWRFEPGNIARVQELIETALELDMNFFDTADIYGRDANGSGFGMAEEMVGQVLAGSPELRDRMVIATKGVDLSVGAVMAISGALLALVYLTGRSLPAPHPSARPTSLLARAARIERWRLHRGGPLPYACAIAAGGVFVLL